MDGLDSRIQVSTDDAAFFVAQGLRTINNDDGRDDINVGAWPDDVDHNRPGPRDSASSLDGLYYPADTLGQIAFRTAMLNKTDLFLRYLRDGAAGWKQQVLVNSFGGNVGRSGVAEVSIGVEGIVARTDVAAITPTLPPLTDAQDGLDARILKSGVETSMSNETMTDSGDGLTFTIDDTTKEVFARLTALTVEVDPGGGFVVNTANTINRLSGSVTFDADQTGNPVQISGFFVPMTTVAEAMEYSWELTRANTDKGRFKDDHMRRGYGPLSFGGSASMFFDSAADFEAIVDTKEIFVVEFQQELVVDLRAWVTLSQDTESSDRSSTVDEAISFSGAADSERRMVSFGAGA